VGPVLTIDIYSDVVCPWCYLGKRRLEAALRARPDIAVAVQWRPFELNPDLPPTGVERDEYLRQKFGDSGRLQEFHRRLVELGREAGIGYRFEAIRRVPNTRAAHALIAASGERQDAVVDGLFRAYFEEARDVGDAAVLAEIGVAAGLDGDELRASLAARRGIEAVAAQEREAARLGISGVPFFVFAGRWAVSGAQEAATLVAALDQVSTELARDPGSPAASVAAGKS
jgi:predicted DsbA family dithiol-disulfide isomerase